MGRLALLNCFLFMFLLPCASNLAGASRLRIQTQCVCACVCGLYGNTEESRETLIGTKDMSPTRCFFKSSQRGTGPQRGVGGLYMHQREPSGSWTTPAGHLASCFPAQLCTGMCYIILRLFRFVHVTYCSCCQLLFSVKQRYHAELFLLLHQTHGNDKSEERLYLILRFITSRLCLWRRLHGRRVWINNERMYF